MRLIDADKLHLKLLDMQFPVQDQDAILDAMDNCIVDAAATAHGMWIDNGWDGDFSWRIDGRGNCWQVISCSVCGGNLCGSAKTSYLLPALWGKDGFERWRSLTLPTA